MALGWPASHLVAEVGKRVREGTNRGSVPLVGLTRNDARAATSCLANNATKLGRSGKVKLEGFIAPSEAARLATVGPASPNTRFPRRRFAPCHRGR